MDSCGEHSCGNGCELVNFRCIFISPRLVIISSLCLRINFISERVDCRYLCLAVLAICPISFECLSSIPFFRGVVMNGEYVRRAQYIIAH